MAPTIANDENGHLSSHCNGESIYFECIFAIQLWKFQSIAQQQKYCREVYLKKGEAKAVHFTKYFLWYNGFFKRELM